LFWLIVLAIGTYATNGIKMKMMVMMTTVAMIMMMMNIDDDDNIIIISIMYMRPIVTDGVAW